MQRPGVWSESFIIEANELGHILRYNDKAPKQVYYLGCLGAGGVHATCMVPKVEQLQIR